MDHKILYLILAMALRMIKCAVPGTFFWRPRLGLDLSIPTTGLYYPLVFITLKVVDMYMKPKDGLFLAQKEEMSMKVNLPSKETIHEGLVVLIDGYQLGMTVVGLAAGLSSAKPYPHLNPTSAYFYTNAYRWALRHLSLIPLWVGGNGGNYCDTHKVWRRRFFYMDEFVPPWLRKIFPVMDKKEWEKEELEYKKFKKIAEPAFGKHYRYPSKIFNDFKSQETKETSESVQSSASSDGL